MRTDSSPIRPSLQGHTLPLFRAPNPLINLGTPAALNPSLLRPHPRSAPLPYPTLSQAATLAFTGSWANTGTLNATNSGVFLGGNITRSNVGTLDRSAGNVSLQSSLNLAGSPLTLDTTTGSWKLLGATSSGGVISLSGDS